MSITKYIYILGLLIFTASCTSSTKQVEESTNTDETALIIETPDTVVYQTEETNTQNTIEETNPTSEAPANEEPAVEDTDAPIEEYRSGSTFVNNSYLILLSTTSYSAAMNTAKKASEQLGHKLDYRGYVFDFKEGLKDTRTCGCGEIHEYVPRGRYDDGNYVSIEHTNSFTEFTDGYYIVVAASGKRKNLRPVLAKAQEYYSDAYIKDAEVYIGCMH